MLGGVLICMAAVWGKGELYHIIRAQTVRLTILGSISFRVKKTPYFRVPSGFFGALRALSNRTNAGLCPRTPNEWFRD